MTTPPIEAVVAGTKGFALALLAPIAKRTGAKPRVAADPAQALVYCGGPHSLVVVEFLGEDSLSAIKDLVLEGGGVRIVAAVPPAHAAAEGPLRALGVDAVRWDGTPDRVVGAVERQIAFASAPQPPARPAAARPAPPAARAAPARPAAAAPGAPALTPPRPQAAVAPRPAAAAPRPAAGPALTPARPVPAVARAAAPGGPALTPSRPPAAVAPMPAGAPALTPAKPPAAVGAMPAGAPALTPPRPVPAAPRPAAPQAPALTPTKPSGAATPRPAAAPALTPSRPVAAVAPPVPAAAPPDDAFFDPFDAELLAAAESLGAPSPARSAPGAASATPSAPHRPAPAAPPRAPAAPPRAAAPAASGPGLFDDLHEGNDPARDIDMHDPGPRLAAPPAGADAPWPTAVPGPVEAADALGRALFGDVAAAGPLAVVSDVLGSLSELERAVLSGQPQPFDTEPIRRAAVLRVRVAVALATAPAPGGAVDDQGAVSAFLADIDALLSDVNALAASAPAEVQASLEAMRNALVKEAIDFSEAVQRAAPAEAFAPARAVARALTGRAAETRILSVSTAAEQELAAGEAKRQRRMFVVLGIAVVAAVAFHGYRYVLRMRGGVEAPTRSSAPSGAFVVAGPRATDPVVLRSRDGKPFAREELSRLIDDERLKGNAVRELGPGVVLITPAPQAAPQPAATQREVKP